MPRRECPTTHLCKSVEKFKIQGIVWKLLYEIPTWNVHCGRGHWRHARVYVVPHLKLHLHAAAARDVDRTGELAARYDLQGARQLDLGLHDVVEKRTPDSHGDGEDVHAQVHRVYSWQLAKIVHYYFEGALYKIGSKETYFGQ